MESQVRRNLGGNVKTSILDVGRIRRRYRLLWTVVLLALAGVASATSLASATSVPAKFDAGNTQKTIKPDYAFFKGKTITYVVPAGVTGVSYEIAAGLAPLISQYLGATVNLEQITGATVVPQDIVGHASPDGLTIGFAVVTNYLLAEATGANQLSFPLLSASFVGATQLSPYGLVSCHDPSLTSFSQLLSKSIPAVTLQSSTLTASSAEEQMLINMYGLPHTYIRSYTNATLQAGCERGDGTIANTSTTQWLNASGTGIAPGAIPLLLSVPIPKSSPQYSAYAGVPTIADFVKQHPPTTALGKRAYKVIGPLLSNSTPYQATIGPKGIPKARLLALQDAYEKAWRSAAMNQVRANVAMGRANLNAKEILAWVKTNLPRAAALNAMLNRP